MAAPVFESAGAGVSNAAGIGTTLTPACPSTVNSGDCLLLHCQNWDDTQTVATPGGWTKISGPNDFTPVRAYLFGRLATGTEGGTTVSVVWSGSANEHAARIYRFSGNALSSTFWEALNFAADVGSIVLDTGVTTLGTDRLALNVVGLDHATAIGPFTGQSGGTWAEATPEYAANALTLQLQTATIAAAGTINGGSVTIGVSSRALIYGLAILPFTTPILPHFIGTGAC